MKLSPNFYNERICLNVLARDRQNAKEIFEETEGHVVIGVLSKNYEQVDEAVEAMSLYGTDLDNAVSIGLGSGDPQQWKMVSDIAKKYKPQHINQVFTGVGHTRSSVDNTETFINCMVSPCGKPGYVNISTGPSSSMNASPAIVEIRSAIHLIKDMGGNSIKYFPMRGLETIEEYRQVVKACAEEQMNIEPTGGIDLQNFKEIVSIPLAAGVIKIIPHVYSSIIDPTTGLTRIDDVRIFYSMIKELVQEYDN
ncbi:oxo-acid lyase [Sporosarcina sp. ANT_H38]|uniref:2-dehydro-3-deoxy-phosphogluconate aldolase n=1 Tax=Sporosarcina sp. ANT_H38 TaxID=2597358 RepID=UPI0011F19AE0|nr:KDGP aldolase family protein [Sporosarcina sp. ANT_H38]KAA0965088.1 oxo-acid lyase [Sporosarcina sp. ANT_H38]